MSCGSSLYLARELKLEMSFYEGGIMRIYIDEKSVNPERFRVSRDIEGVIEIDDSDLIDVQNHSTIVENGVIVRFEEGQEFRI